MDSSDKQTLTKCYSSIKDLRVAVLSNNQKSLWVCICISSHLNVLHSKNMLSVLHCFCTVMSQREFQMKAVIRVLNMLVAKKKQPIYQIQLKKKRVLAIIQTFHSLTAVN